jgi:WXG100 family type VII secretion target
MTSYGLNPNGLLDTSSELRGITSILQNTMDDLNSQVQTYIAANEGDTPGSFTAAQQLWNQGLDQMRVALDKASVNLDQIHDNYKLGDVHGASLFQGRV